jgi:non-ribosomal peptide synthetase-like protein
METIENAPSSSLNAPTSSLEECGHALGEPPLGRTLLDIFADTVDRHEDRVAIDAVDAALTYAQLADAADRVADELRTAGVGPGDRVGIRLPSGSSSLYVGILGVLRAGGAYVPVDGDDPAPRAEAIWESAEVCGVLRDGLSFARRRPISERSPAGVGREPTVEDDAWIIFTSGSTGHPKGVAVSHRAAAAFVDAEARLWTVDPEDRVLAGLSVSFDASCEEMWLAWANGAALVPAPRALTRTGIDLGPWLAEHGATVISTVPTLAAMWDDDVLDRVRLVILGGEPCPPELAWRLAAGREVWNTYGPTEATVVSTAARVHPGVPVTIGWPLAGWQVAVVDDAGEPVTLGETGELIIGGAGLARYLDPLLDGERYAALPALGWERAYRSGDLVRETVHGLDFVGRRDQQVKLAGRRLELGEVEAQLRAVKGVRAAAVVVQTTAAANKILVGYVVGDVNPEHVRAQVAEQLPDGLAPLVVVLESMPMAISGKVDRAALPWPLVSTCDPDEAPLTGTAAWLAERWAEQLGPVAFAADADFFELGGTSVAAAKLVSLLRRRFPSVAVADVYEHRRLGQLAERLDALGEGRREVPDHRAVAARGGRAAQLAGVFLLLTFTVPAWLEGVFAYNNLFGGGTQLAWPALIGGYLLFVSAPGRTLIVAAARRLLLGGLKPGRYPRHSWIACRVWFVDRLGEVLNVNRVGGTPWASRLARLLGAEVGSDVRLGTLPSPASLIRIGAGATLEGDVDVHGWWVEGSELVVGQLEIGSGARVGARSVLMPGADIGPNAEIEPGSVVSTHIPAGERWAGTPARRVGDADGVWPREDPPCEPHARFWKAMFGVGLFGINALTIVAAIPGLLLMESFNPLSSSVPGTVTALLVGAPLLAATFVLGEAVLSALVFRLVTRAVKPGWHGDEGATAWALWFGERVMESARSTLFPLYATIYMRWWLRLHGLRVGRRTEVSTAQGLNRLVTMGDTTFVADAPMFTVARAHRGWIQLEPIAVGSRTFIGNGALLTGGTIVGDGSLIGIESTAPRHAPDGTSWFGGPPIELPRVPDRTDPSRTTDPPLRLVLARGVTELVRILLPGTVSVVLGTLIFVALDAIGSAAGALALMAAAPLVVLAAALCAVLFTIALKWLIIGRYRPSEHPLWSFFVWRDEIMNSCQEQLAGDWLMNKAQGTALMPVYLRAMGADIGHDVWCETLAVTEFDVVKVADGCAINRGACLETHLFHDRLMRIGPNDLGLGSTLGPHSATLPDTKLGPGCVVGGRSVVLRGEELPANTRWHGVPVRMKV